MGHAEGLQLHLTAVLLERHKGVGPSNCLIQTAYK